MLCEICSHCLTLQAKFHSVIKKCIILQDSCSYTHLCPISCATTKTLSKCLPSLIVQLDVVVHIPATGARPTTWLLTLPFFATTYKSKPTSNPTEAINKLCSHEIKSHERTCQNDRMIEMHDILIRGWIKFALPRAKAVQKHIDIAGPTQFLWIGMQYFQSFEHEIDFIAQRWMMVEQLDLQKKDNQSKS